MPKHFNSRSCEGATRLRREDDPREVISTHAPVKERLSRDTDERFARRMSTHAPVKERRGALHRTAYIDHFNSRSCEGATSVFVGISDRNIFQLTLL